jgi:hypothetical protein
MTLFPLFSISTSFILISTVLISCQKEKGRFVDEDGDGYALEEGDCDDTNPLIHPDATDECDGIDNNCDGEIDEVNRYAHIWYQDADLDGYGGDEVMYSCSQPSGYVSNSEDCDDTNDSIHPLAEESLLDIGIDNRCDGFNYQEILSIRNNSVLPSHTEFTFVPNLNFMGPTFFFSGTTLNHKFSFNEQNIEYELLETGTAWTDGFAVRNTEFWYLIEYPEERFETKNFTSDSTLLFSSPIQNMISLENVWGQTEHSTGILLSDGEEQIVLLFSDEEHTVASEADLSLILVEPSLLDIQNAPDVDNDGYNEVWLSFAEYGLLLFGGEEKALNTDNAWKVYYEQPCKKIVFSSWFDEERPNAICQNDHISIWEIGSPVTTYEDSEAYTLTMESTVTDMVATTQYIIAHHKNDGFVTVYNPDTTSNTELIFSEEVIEKSSLFLIPSGLSPYSSFFIIDSQRAMLSYDELGLFPK